MTTKVLEQTSASFGRGAWQFQPPLENGDLSVLMVDEDRALVFRGNSSGLLTLDEENIVSARKVAGGFNTIVDVVVRASTGDTLTVCFVGPRGRMKTVFATLGHPL